MIPQIKSMTTNFHACIPKPFASEIIEESLERIIGTTDS